MTSDDNGSPLPAWLDASGLPWRSTRAELAARYGVSTDNPYQWEVVSLAVAPPPLDGLLWPFGFQAFDRYSPAMPPTRMTSHLWFEDDAEANVRRALEQLAPHFGPRAIEARYNILQAEWRWGDASVSLMAWPPDENRDMLSSNPAHERDPRLDTACPIEIQTGWRPPLSPVERQWLEAFEPLAATRIPAPAPSTTGTPSGFFAETSLEFMRQPPPDLPVRDGVFGISPGGEALIIRDHSLYVIPLEQVAGYDVTRTLPAKGGGGSYLSARCTTGYAACPEKPVRIAEGERADDLNAIATELAARTGKPLILGDYGYDA